MTSMKLKNIKRKVDKTVEECYMEYIEHCIAIGQREMTIESKKMFNLSVC